MLVLVDVKVVKVEKVEAKRLIHGMQTVEDGNAVLSPAI